MAIRSIISVAEFVVSVSEISSVSFSSSSSFAKTRSFFTKTKKCCTSIIYSKIPNSEHEKKALEVIEQVGLTHRLKNKSNELSGGERQRVAIARALVNNPSLILADEPTGNLDSKMGEEIEKILINLNNEGRTLILVTHDDDLAKIAKRQIILKDGSIISER